MTLIMKNDVDALKMYLRTNSVISRSRHSKLRDRTGQARRHTDRCDRTLYHAASAGGKKSQI